MSEPKKTKAAEETAAETKAETALDPEELVDYTAPLLPGKTKQEVTVVVNGDRLAIKRGVTVKIKRKYKEALDNAAQQNYAAFQTMTDIRKQGDSAAVKM